MYSALSALNRILNGVLESLCRTAVDRIGVLRPDESPPVLGVPDLLAAAKSLLKCELAKHAVSEMSGVRAAPMLQMRTAWRAVVSLRRCGGLMRQRPSRLCWSIFRPRF